MSWQERVRARLQQDQADAEQGQRCGEILNAILDGFERGGSDAVADAIRQRLQVIEAAFDESLRKLEAKL